MDGPLLDSNGVTTFGKNYHSIYTALKDFKMLGAFSVNLELFMQDILEVFKRVHPKQKCYYKSGL